MDETESASDPTPLSAGAASATTPEQPKPVMGFRDLVLFYVVTGVSLRWIATAAAAGPSSIIIWIGAFLFFYTPLALSVIELSSRYPEEGGVYVWAKRAFGDFAGFITAWTYWVCNLPYFPAVLYFAASNALYIRHDWERFSNNTTYYIVFSLVALTLATLLNIYGLNVGTWLHNLGAVAMWIPVGIIVAMGAVAWHRYGTATSFTLHSMTPGVQLKDMIFWSVLIFAFAGCETASIMGGEIKNARRAIPRALLIAGVTVTFCYIVGTISVLVALPASEVGNLQGLMQAISKTAERIGFEAVIPFAALLIMLSNVGAAGAYLGCGRAFAVRGRNRSLPAAGLRSAPSPMEDAVGRPAYPIRLRRAVHFSRAGRNQHQGRLRRAGQHGRDHILHSVPVFVCCDVQAAEGTRRAGCDPRARRQAGSQVGRDRRLRDHDFHHRTVVDPAAGRTQQAAGSDQDRGIVGIAGADWRLDLLGRQRSGH